MILVIGFKTVAARGLVNGRGHLRWEGFSFKTDNRNHG